MRWNSEKAREQPKGRYRRKHKNTSVSLHAFSSANPSPIQSQSNGISAKSNQAITEKAKRTRKLVLEKLPERNTGKPKVCAHNFFIVNGETACPHRCKK